MSKGILRNLCWPWWVLKVLNSDDFWSKWTDQKPLLASSFQNTFDSASLCVASPSVKVLWCSMECYIIMCFPQKVRDDIHAVRVGSGAIIPRLIVCGHYSLDMLYKVDTWVHGDVILTRHWTYYIKGCWEHNIPVVHAWEYTVAWQTGTGRLG